MEPAHPRAAGVAAAAYVFLSALQRRPLFAALAATALALVAYLYVPLPAPRAAAASAGDCVELHLYSNGYHSDIGAPAAIFPPEHPLRRLYPQARSFLIGWGEERFYYSDGRDLALGLDAMLPPSPSVLHIAYDAAPASAYIGPIDDVAIGVSQDGAARFVAFVDRALVLDDVGAAVRTADGKVVGRSSFLRARGSFHLFNVCNHWMARGLRAAGVDVNARTAWLASPLIAQVRARGATRCPA